MAITQRCITLCFAAALLGNAGYIHVCYGDEFTADIETVRKLLQQDAAFTVTEREQAYAVLEPLSKRASDISTAAFQLEVSRIFALAHNGHTMLVAGLWPSQFNRIPVRTHVFADGLFIIDADEPTLIGEKILAIDDHPVDELRQAFAQYWGAVPGKRDDWLGYWLESAELLHAAGLAEKPDVLTLRVQNSKGKISEVSLPATVQPPAHGRYTFFSHSRLVELLPANLSPRIPTPLYLAEPDKLFRYASLPDLNAFYLQLRYNTHAAGQRLDSSFIDAVLAAIAAQKPQHIIVDLRLNSGGDLNNTRALMQTLPTMLPPNGKIFAITSGRTFSAGIASLGYLKQAGGDRVVIVGEPIGDALEYWAEGNLVELPVSKAEVLIATERHNYVTGCPEDDCHGSILKHPIRVQSLAPDISAPLRYQDYQHGIDPALRAIAAALKTTL
ncbi:hypothetical protein HPT27_11135 [Permianibacter sp. IMCC34836]|uniref:hypothetical protein n=1 Tax=Permianibacter fluminis TaxID=2738515 RepID=UPI001552E2A0|nr:hypothetical protein [Permianibacter fluminis]NQD37581.1 hypothetical protein [Permianibacter fluminis]